jgi:hypothetical protein
MFEAKTGSTDKTVFSDRSKQATNFGLQAFHLCCDQNIY